MDISSFSRPLLETIGFVDIVSADQISGEVRVRYAARREFAHSGGKVVQGGIVTAWLDSAMAMAVAAREAGAVVATLEMKVSFFEVVGVDTFEVMARPVRWGRSVAFLEADLYSAGGGLLARASSTGKLLRPK